MATAAMLHYHSPVNARTDEDVGKNILFGLILLIIEITYLCRNMAFDYKKEYKEFYLCLLL